MSLLKPAIFVTLLGTSQAVSANEARDLGHLLAAESFCELSYDQEAVQGWIDANVDPSNLSFPGDLSSYREVAVYSLEDLAGSAKTAHCHAIQRTARHLGFIK